MVHGLGEKGLQWGESGSPLGGGDHGLHPISLDADESDFGPDR